MIPNYTRIKHRLATFKKVLFFSVNLVLEIKATVTFLVIFKRVINIWRPCYHCWQLPVYKQFKRNEWVDWLVLNKNAQTPV